MPWNDLASNQMVSYTDAQGGGFTLQPGQSAVNNNVSNNATGYYIDCCTGEEMFIELEPYNPENPSGSSIVICSKTPNPYNVSTYLQWELYFVQDCLPCPPQ